MEELTALISNVGFPIAISSYVIIVLNKTLQENTKALQELNAKINEKEV